MARESAGNLVSVKWSPVARLGMQWLGVDGTTTSPGFISLRNHTSEGPGVVAGSYSSQPKDAQKKICRDLSHPAVLDHLTKEGFASAMPWLLECATKGAIPIHRVLETECTPGEIGRLVEIGVPGNLVQVRAIMDAPAATASEFYALPASLMDLVRARRERTPALELMPSLR